jgi:rhodanese-related sulfurtransferase
MKFFCLSCKKFFCQCKDTKKVITAPACALKTITAEKLKEKMERMMSLKVVNALSKKAYDACHIKGSINVPLEVLPAIARSWDTKAEIVVYCANAQCPVSKGAFTQLCEMGFEKVTAYEGGIDEWKLKGYPVETSITTP